MGDDEESSESKHTESKHKAKHEKQVYMEHTQHKKNQTYKVTTWVFGILSVVLLALFIVSIVTGGFGSGTGSSVKALSQAEIKTRTQAYLATLVQGQTVSIDSITDRGDLYALGLTVAGKQYQSYVTKDGAILFPSGIDMTAQVPAASNAAAQTPTAVPKTDKPKVELFVMSYCPFGTQAEKGILPAVRALGDKIDFSVKFVYYSMHGQKEVNENLNQYCIETEQPDKYLKYLACFLNDSAGQGSQSAIDACVQSTGVDTAKLDACKIADDKAFNVTANYNDQASWLNGQFPKVDLNLADNLKYNVGGSPTLVINGVTYNDKGQRSPANFQSYICAAFNNAPAECQTTLSNTQPGPGFGYDSVGAANAAGCGA